MPDHVHVLARLDPGVPVARLVGEAKGFSSHQTRDALAWQAGYAAYSVSLDDREAVRRYVVDQQAHHAAHRLLEDLELDSN